MKLTKIITLSSLVALSFTIGTTFASAVGAEYESNGAVQFVPNTDPTNPVDPINPDPEKPVDPIDPTDPIGPNPGTNGPLSIDFASSLDFGLNKISNQNQTYYARSQRFTNLTDRPNYIQVSDNRGTNSGWTLKVKQDGQFTATTTTLNSVLTGAQVTLKNPTITSNGTATAPIATNTIVLNPDGTEVIVMSATDQAGAGTWINSWGTVEEVTEKDINGNDVQVNVTKDITLDVPGATPKDAVKYQTKLIWTLTDVPGNP